MQNSPWKNWSGAVQFAPKEVLFPQTEEEIVQIVRRCQREGHCLRVVGAAHSFTPLVETTGILVSLDRMQGIVSVDKDRYRVTVWAGTRLRQLGDLLHAQGLAMENLGDIDVQAIAGALSTGTHGTGMGLGTLSTQLRSVTFVNGQGDLVTCSPDNQPDLFRAAQISLGSLGVITRLELQAVPAYKLKYISAKSTLSEVLSRLEDYKTRNRNFEFYWFPFTQTVQTKELNIVDEPPKSRGFGHWFNEMFMENGLFSVLSNISRFVPGTSAGVSKLSAWGVSTGKDVNWSHKVFATRRLVRFHEMEYNLPKDRFESALREIEATITRQKFRVHFPLECRWVKADDILLSPAHGRDSAYIAVHMFKGMPYKDYFAAMEEILQRHDGRPHWGKMHTLTAAGLRPRYPKWDEFQTLRKQMDPKGIFMSPYLKALLEG